MGQAKMVKHNNVIPNQHFHKDWQRYVKTWFNQPGKKKSRRLKRAKNAKDVGPSPADGPLRSIVRCTTQRHNRRVRAGRGFTLAELLRPRSALSLLVQLALPWTRAAPIAPSKRSRRTWLVYGNTKQALLFSPPRTKSAN